MYRKRLQLIIATGRWTLPVVILLSGFCWMLSALLVPNNLWAIQNDYPTWLNSDLQQQLPTGVGQLISMVIYGVVGYFLIELNNAFALIRTRATVQTSLYFTIVAICPFIHHLSAGCIASLALLIAIFFLFRSYQSRTSSGYLFHSFAFIGLGSLVLPQLLFVTPIWFVGAVMFQSLSPRSLFAALLGVCFPYWFLFCLAFVTDNMTLFYQPFTELVNLSPISYLEYLTWSEVATLGYIILLFIAALVHRTINGHKNNIRTSAYLDFLNTLTFFLLVLTALQPSLGTELLPTLILITSVLTGHIFAMTNTKASNRFFIFSLSLLILLFAFNIWMPF